MRLCPILLFLVLPLCAQNAPDGPLSDKAQKSYNEGLERLKHGQIPIALDSFKKADKQDGGRCLACQRQVIKYATQIGDWKAAEAAACELVSEATDARTRAIAHYNMGMVLMNEGMARRKDDLFAHVHDEMTQALSSAPNFPLACFVDGQALAHMKQDDAAKALWILISPARRRTTSM